MNKKGALFHWIIFGILAAIGLFFLITSKSQVTTTVKGTWQLDFVKDNYLEAELTKTVITSQAQLVGREVITEMAAKAGYLHHEQSTCGHLNEIPFWNKGEEWCFPNVKQHATNLAKPKLEEAFLPRTFTNIEFKNNLFLGTGEKDSISTDYAKYTFDTSFAANMNYNFNEYLQLQQEAQQIVNLCRNQANQQECFQNIPNIHHWNHASCREEVPFPTDTGFLKFCVVSLQDESIQYRLMLDLNPTGPITVETSTLTFNEAESTFTLTFTEDLFADSYIIYFTDWPFDERASGTPFELSNRVLNGWFFKSHQIETLIQDCPLTKLPNTAYVCDDTVVYEIHDESLIVENPQTFYFAITSTRDNQESNIQSFQPMANIVS